MTDPASQRAAIAANRFGLGARPGDLTGIRPDPEAWLLAQLERDGATARVRAQPGATAILAELQAHQREVRELRASGDQESMQQAQRENLRRGAEHYREQAGFRHTEAVRTDEPFRERLVRFWSNHFAVSADKLTVTAIAGTLENEAIRPHVTGRFVDLLNAVERHPAMLLYLDNVTSAGPQSQLARAADRRGRDVGLNENLAREILELHTLGVDGGYTQDDVTSFAKVITGWSAGGGPGPLARGTSGEFQFRPAMHEPGAKIVLGKRYAEGGVDEGEAVLRDLARHPATALHVATKLARHFAADEPPPALVDRLTGVYLDTDGDLAYLYRALVSAREPWAAPYAKLKTPEEFVVSTYRALGRAPEAPERTIGILTQLGQRPYTPGSPAGWPDTSAQWDGSDALFKRIEWAGAMGQAVGDRLAPLEVAAAALGDTLGARTREAIARAESAAQALTLFLASPEFQRR